MRGGQHQVLLLMNALREAGHESLLLAPEVSPLANAARQARFAVYASSAREVWRHSRQVSLIHAHDARAHTLAAVASRCKFVVSRRVAFPVRRSIASFWKYRRPARFLAVSHFVAGELEAAGIPKQRIDIVYDGVESPSAAEWSARYPAVALASPDPQKGRPLVEQAAKLAGIPVVFSNTLPEDLTHASSFVYITRSEGLGSAVLLAMSMGVPVIASRVGGLTEIFSDGISGLFVANEAQAIAGAMRRVVEDGTLARLLIERGKARIAECFTKQHLLQGTLASYRSALAS